PPPWQRIDGGQLVLRMPEGRHVRAEPDRGQIGAHALGSRAPGAHAPREGPSAPEAGGEYRIEARIYLLPIAETRRLRHLVVHLGEFRQLDVVEVADRVSTATR